MYLNYNYKSPAGRRVWLTTRAKSTQFHSVSAISSRHSEFISGIEFHRFREAALSHLGDIPLRDFPSLEGLLPENLIFCNAFRELDLKPTSFEGGQPAGFVLPKLREQKAKRLEYCELCIRRALRFDVGSNIWELTHVLKQRPPIESLQSLWYWHDPDHQNVVMQVSNNEIEGVWREWCKPARYLVYDRAIYKTHKTNEELAEGGIQLAPHIEYTEDQLLDLREKMDRLYDTINDLPERLIDNMFQDPLIRDHVLKDFRNQ